MIGRDVIGENFSEEKFSPCPFEKTSGKGDAAPAFYRCVR